MCGRDMSDKHIENKNESPNKRTRIVITAIMLLLIILVSSKLKDITSQGKSMLTKEANTTQEQELLNTKETTKGNEQDHNQDQKQVGVNACGSENYWLPDLERTEREGGTCADNIFNFLGDNDCIANPPTNYDGTINLATGESNPKITCCQSDGTCEW